MSDERLFVLDPGAAVPRSLEAYFRRKWSHLLYLTVYNRYIGDVVPCLNS